MPRDSAGNYTLPAGNPVISQTVITSDWANTTMPDIGNALTDSLSRTGQGGMLVPMTFVDGSIAEPGIAFSLEPTLGWYRPSQSVMALAVLGNEGLSYNGADEILSVLGQARVTEPEPLTDPDLTRKDYVDALIALKVNLDGDTMTGQLNGLEPVDPTNMATKNYVDTAVGGGASTFVLKAGDTMTGQLIGITPLAAGDLTRKDYVDGLIAGVGGSVTDRVFRTGDTMTGQLNGLVPVAAANMTRKDYVDDLDVQNVKLSGDQAVQGLKTFQTAPRSDVTPTDDADLARKDYVDDGDLAANNNADGRVSRGGDTMTGQLEGITPVDPADMTRKDYVDNLDVENVKLTGNQTVAGTKTHSSPILMSIGQDPSPDSLTRKDYVDDQDLLRVLKTGDTMTGQLVLPGGGTGLQAATFNDVNLRQLLSEKGAVSGYAPLNASSLVPPNFLPFTAIEFLGAWDASGNTLPPTPAAGGGYYIISVAGTLNVVPADGSSPTPTPTAVAVGDDIFYSADTTFWYQVVPSHLQNDARYLQLAGGTVTGQVNGITPVSPANFTRKDYVDGLDGANVKLTGAQNVGGQKTFNTDNPLSLAGQSSDANALTKKTYVDGQVALKLALTGGTVTGQINGITPTAAANLTRKDYIDGLDGQNVKITGNQSIAGIKTHTSAVRGITPSNIGDFTRKDYVDQQVATRLLLTGGTMTGQINGITPTAVANLTRKDYVDNANNLKVNKSGDTMTGQLNGITPTAAANLVRKDYSDLNKLDFDFLRTGDRLDINNVRTS